MNPVDKTPDKLPATAELIGVNKPKPSGQKLGQEDFLRLMTAQLNNQDPTKPMENGEFLTQMAQFSTVEGVKEIKETFSSLAESLQSSQALQASSMVGRQVLVPGNTGTLSEGGELRGAVDLPATTPALRIDIQDQSGALVHSIHLKNQSAGLVNFSWDGRVKDTLNPEGDEGGEVQGQAEPGQYTIQAVVHMDGKAQSVDTLVADKVESVSLQKGGRGMSLNLANSKSKALSEIRQIM